MRNHRISSTVEGQKMGGMEGVKFSCFSFSGGYQMKEIKDGTATHSTSLGFGHGFEDFVRREAGD